jgi:anti-sigma regulatory factor (Ser/Thr protein kinase)
VPAACAHGAQLYERDDDLVEAVGSHLAVGLRTGGAAIAIATPPHLREFAAAIAAAGADTTRLTALDAGATLERFCTGGRIDGAAFQDVVGGILREAAAGGGPVRVYGEMVALLWDAGDIAAALELEELWNDLGRELEFSLLCGYHLDSVANEERALRDVCRLHSTVESTGQFNAVREAPRAARRFVTDALRRHGAARALLFDAHVIVTELASNAVSHARSRFSVAVCTSGPVVRIAVRDASPAAPVRQKAEPAEGSGRGVALIETIASDWGIERAGRGKTVWAELRS